MKYIYMACLSIGCVFFVLRGMHNSIFPTALQKLIQPTTADSVRIQQPNTTIVQQNIREERNTIEISDDIQQSIQKLQARTVTLDVPTTAPGQTLHQGLIISNDGLVLISKAQGSDGRDTIIQATTHNNKTYTGTVITISSPYYDILELDLGEDIRGGDISFAPLQSVPSIGEIITGIQHSEPGIISGQINIISSTSGIRHQTQFPSTNPHTFYTRLNGDILGSNISGATTTIFPITAEFISHVIDEINRSKGNNSEKITTFASLSIPFGIAKKRAHIGHTVWGREIAEDIYINDEKTIGSESLITHINGIEIDTTLDPTTYAPLFLEETELSYMTDGQKKKAIITVD